MAVLTLAQLAHLANDHRRAGRTVVLCHGTFDPLHPGHVDHLQRAAALGDALFVTVTGDAWVRKGPGRPILDQQRRADMIAALRCVDGVAICEGQSAVPAIQAIRPDLYVKGKDYEDKLADPALMAEIEATIAGGGQLKFIASDPHLSASGLIAKGGLLERPAGIDAFLATIDRDDVFRSLEAARGCNVVVVGEAIEDIYVSTLPLARSPKEYAPAVLEAGTRSWRGGSLAIATNLESIHDAKVSLVTNPPGMIAKTRFVTYGNVKIFETYRIDASEFSGDEPLRQAARMAHEQIALLVVADFGHGYISAAAAATLPLDLWTALTVQANSGNWGFNLIGKYPRYRYLVMDEPEARLALQEPREEITHAMLRILGEHCPTGPIIVMTMGRKGCRMVNMGDFGRDERLDAPPLNPRPLDTMGAGDAFLAATAPLARIGAKASTIALVGSAAAAIKCTIPGHERAVGRGELIKYLQTLLG